MLVPACVVEVLRRREAVLVAGPGCGALAGVPRWPALIRAMADRLGVLRPGEGEEAMTLAASGRTGAALATLVDRLGSEAAGAVVAELTAGERDVPPVLVALAAAPWRAVVTTG